MARNKRREITAPMFRQADGRPVAAGQAGDLASSALSSTASQVVPASHSSYVSGVYAITDALSLSIEGDGKFEIG